MAETSRAASPVPRMRVAVILFMSFLSEVLGEVGLEVAVEVGGGDAAVDEEVAAGDERAVGAHQERAERADLVGGAGSSGGAQLDHAPVALAAWSGQFVAGERGHDDAGADRVDPCASFAPPDGLGLDPQRVAALGELVGVERVGHLVRLQHRQGQELVGRCRRQRGVLLGGEGAEAMAGLRRDDDPGAALGDDVAELLEHDCGAVQVDGEDRRRGCLARRDPGGVDHPGDVAECCGGLGEGVDRARARTTSTVAVVTSNPASRKTSAAASAFSMRRSASTTCLPVLTRRAIA